MRVLLIEDDVLLGEGIAQGLKHFDIVTDWVTTAEQGLAAINTEFFNAVIVDVNLPKISGFEFLRKVRNSGDNIPIIVMTARDEISDRLSGLDSGADDYLIKPVDIRELAARIRSLVRRSSGLASNEIKIGSLTLNSTSHEVFYQQRKIDLSIKEYSVLYVLMMNPGKIVSKDKILQSLYSWGSEVESNVIEVYIHGIRKKISQKIIVTVRGFGYMLPKDAP